jgi:NhaP-type Na+/H+ and K+/H+ antiporter
VSDVPQLRPARSRQTPPTLLHGGSVYAVEREHMPDATLIAAVFRHDPASKLEGKEEVTRGDTSILAVSQAHRSVN